jgi:AcrR family transcriptional regulator
MNEKFFDLKKTKQDRMINGIMKVFAMDGYRDAGTEDMVREAGISKGLLFHYFDNKLGAYAFVYSYAVRYLNLELEGTLSPEEKDPYTIAAQAQDAAVAAMRNYPYIQYFLQRTTFETQEEALKATAVMRGQLAGLQMRIRNQADASLFGGRDPELTWKLMDYAIRGLTEETVRKEQFDPEEFRETAHTLIDAFRMKEHDRSITD